MRTHRFTFSLLLAASLLPAASVGVLAQDFFIPGQPKGTPGAPSKPPVRQVRPPAAAAPAPSPPTNPPPGPADAGASAADSGGAAPTPASQMALPPPADVPALPKGVSPPAAVIGVLDTEVVRACNAAQLALKTIAERREKLERDAQKEQSAWREMQQSLVNERGKLTADQGRARERELQDRITTSQRQLRDRGRIIQEAAQFGFAQVYRTLGSVIQRVAEARGMNLVLNRQQVALNANEFDITEQVVDQMNKILPSVVIPPDGVAPPKLAAAASSGPATAGPAIAPPAAPGPLPGPTTPGSPATPAN